MRSTAGFPGWPRHMALDHMPARRWRPVLQIVAPRDSRRAEVLHTATRGCLGNSLVFRCQLASSRPTPTRCCRTASGAATGRRRSRQRQRRARGVNRRPCRMPSLWRGWRPTRWARCWPTGHGPQEPPGGGAGEPRAGVFIGLHVMQRNIPQLQYLRPASTDLPKRHGRKEGRLH